MSVKGRERLEECNRTRQRVGWKRWKWKFERIEGGFWTGLRGGAFQGNGEFHRVTVESELREPGHFLYIFVGGMEVIPGGKRSSFL